MAALTSLHDLFVLLNGLDESLECWSLGEHMHRFPACVNGFVRAFVRIPKLTNINSDEPIGDEVSNVDFDLGWVNVNDRSGSRMVNAGANARSLIHVET